MANELNISHNSGATVYALLFDAQTRIWNGSAFQIPVAANGADYPIPLTEIGATGVYVADFPDLDRGRYEVQYREQLGASFAWDDDRIGSEVIDWTGTGEAAPSSDAWPTAADVEAVLADAGVTLRSSERVQSVLDAVIAEVAQRTQRQFAPDTEDTTRYYNGSGTAQLEVDEILELTSVTVIGVQSDPGYTLADVQIVSQQERPQTLLVVGRGNLPAIGPTAYPRFFPAGRLNIAVTGRYGYAETIPADLWEAVCGEAAARVANEAIFRPGGRLQSYKDGEVDETYHLGVTATSEAGLEPTVGLGWHRRFEAAIRRYKRPVGRKLRRLVAPMV